MHTKGPCPYCRENHEPRPLSFDGFGINSCGIYRDRLATFATGQDETTRKALATLWIAAPDLLKVLKAALTTIERDMPLKERNEIRDQVNRAIATAEGRR